MEPPEQLMTVEIIIIIVVKLSRFFIMGEIWTADLYSKS